jgi:hypothetical protein
MKRPGVQRSQLGVLEMDRLDLIYSVVIYSVAAMLSLCTSMLLTAAFLVLAPSRKSTFSATGYELRVKSYSKAVNPEIHRDSSELEVRSA